MNTEPAVTKFIDREKITIQQNTRATADAEGKSYEFSRISPGHYACANKDTTHIIIEKDGKIGCSCGDMTYRCRGNGGCKHISEFFNLDVPPQIPASGELIKKLMLMGWVGGKDDLHPAELLRTPPTGSDEGTDAAPEPTMEHYECPKCGMVIDIAPTKLQDWKLNHIDVCSGSNKVVESSNQPPKPPSEYPDHARSELKTETVEPQPDAEPSEPDETISSTITDAQVPTNLATALCNMQKIDLLAIQDSDNPFHNAKYADLASVWAAIRKPLTDNGLAVIQTTEPYPGGITVVTTLVHVSGETFTSRLSCEVPEPRPDKNGHIKPSIQGLGSTITYLRRYSLAAMVGVAPIDDDGEAAMSR